MNVKNTQTIQVIPVEIARVTTKAIFHRFRKVGLVDLTQSDPVMFHLLRPQLHVTYINSIVTVT